MKKRLLITGLIGLLLAGLGYSAYYSVWTGATIRKVIISSPYPLRYDAKEISGKKMFFINERQLNAHILQKNPAIKTVIIEKIFPDALQLTAIARRPVAQLIPSSVPRYIDEEGVVLSQTDTAMKLPVIATWGIPVYWNQKADWRLLKAVHYVQLTAKESIPLSRITMEDTGSYYSIIAGPGITIYAPYAGNPGSLVASLQVILGRFKIEGKRVSVIDFRFGKPVVTFQTGEKMSPL